MLNIIKSSVVTEKSTSIRENYDQYVFDVRPHLTKTQIRSLVEEGFSVRVISINTRIRPQKKLHRASISTYRSSLLKRSIITVSKGEINKFL
jgi:ribosomal protein L23